MVKTGKHTRLVEHLQVPLASLVVATLSRVAAKRVHHGVSALGVSQEGNLGVRAPLMVSGESLLKGNGALLLGIAVVGERGGIVDGFDGRSGNLEGDVPGHNAHPAETRSFTAAAGNDQVEAGGAGLLTDVVGNRGSGLNKAGDDCPHFGGR